MMRYVVSCKRCQFHADAIDLCALGSLLNTHGASCQDEALLALAETQDQRHCRTSQLRAMHSEFPSTSEPELLKHPA
jgi:hypothetical protein